MIEQYGNDPQPSKLRAEGSSPSAPTKNQQVPSPSEKRASAKTQADAHVLARNWPPPLPDHFAYGEFRAALTAARRVPRTGTRK